jgi:parallel beta-helix repeat protein
VSIVGFRIENQLGAGISLVLADRCEIRSNRVSHTAAQSIALTRSTFNLVADNTLADGTIGVGLSTVSNDNTVKENTITGAFIHGIRVSMVNQTPLRNVIKENLVCAQDASSLTGVLIAGFASGNIVKENRIVGNGGKTAGIRLELETTGNLVKENVLNRHAIDIDDLGTGNTVKENERHRSLRCP